MHLISLGPEDTDLDIIAHDEVGLVGGLVLALHPGLPPLLHGESCQHDGFAATQGRSAH